VLRRGGSAGHLRDRATSRRGCWRPALRLTRSPITGRERLAGEGTITQVTNDLEHLQLMGADTVVLDPFNGDPDETRNPETAWHVVATMADIWNPPAQSIETEHR
jgi:hypothetical protein